MVRQAWLVPVRYNGGAGYQLTVRAVHRLDEAAARYGRCGRPAWSGQFDLVVLGAPVPRPSRARISTTLAYLGYGSLDPVIWVAPRAAAEVDALLADSGIAFERFTATHVAGSTSAAALVRRAWDVDQLAEEYERFIAELSPVMRTASGPIADEAAYAARFQLVHAWRAFLFSDPQLPAELLPSPWPGTAAAAFFDQHEARLRPAADRFVDTCLTS